MGRGEKETNRHWVCGEQQRGGTWQLFRAEQEVLILGAS